MGPYQQTDTGNARMLAEMFHDRIRYVTKIKKWISWNGKKWDQDGGDLAARWYTRGVSTERYNKIRDETSDKGKNAARAFWKYTASATGARNMLYFAQSEPVLQIGPDDLDKDVYLLNVQDGTVDMRTGKLKPHNPNDLITQIADVSFLANRENIPIPKWEKSLKDWHPRGDMDGTWAYLQELMGLCCTGDTSSRCFPIFWGEGKNGKNAFLDTFLLLLGEYATIAPRTLVKAHKFDTEQHPTEIAALWGKRLVLASEPPKGNTLRVDMVKALTGDEKMTARFMRADFFDFTPTHKIIMLTNHLPKVQETEDAIWDRLHKIPWSMRISSERQIPNYSGGYLREEWPGILRWAIQGYVRLTGRKPPTLQPTKLIVHETEDYRREQNPAKSFVDSLFVVGAGLFTPSGDMNRMFSEWITDFHTGDAVPTMGDLHEHLKSLGCDNRTKRINGEKNRGWFGIGMRAF